MRDVPVHALRMQAYLAEHRVKAKALAAFLVAVSDLGLEVKSPISMAPIVCYHAMLRQSTRA
jgi:hypothetical protein